MLDSSLNMSVRFVIMLVISLSVLQVTSSSTDEEDGAEGSILDVLLLTLRKETYSLLPV